MQPQRRLVNYTFKTNTECHNGIIPAFALELFSSKQRCKHFKCFKLFPALVGLVLTLQTKTDG